MQQRRCSPRKVLHRVSVRAIASAAGVSPGLVTHHFGPKEGLRRVCDEHVASGLFDEHFEQTSPGSLVRSLAEEVGAGSAKIDYIARMLVEPGTAGDELFNRLLASTARRLAARQEAGAVRSGCDTPVTALIVTVCELAQLVLRERFGSALGADPFSPEGVGRQAHRAHPRIAEPRSLCQRHHSGPPLVRS